MPLSFRQLEVVRAVARHGVVTAAAAELGVSQPAVSMMLRECAASAGFPLFERRRGRLQPSTALRAFLDDIERVFTGLDRINRLMAEMRDASRRPVVIAATPTLADNLLPDAIAAFRLRRPQIPLAIHTMDNLAAVDAVTQGAVDFGLVLTPVAGADLTTVPLCRGALVCLVHPESPLARREVVEPHDLLPYPLISFSRSLPLGALVESSFQEAGVPRRIAIEVSQSSVASRLVRAGAGVAIVDPFLATGEGERGILRLPFRPITAVGAEALIQREGSLARPALMLLALLWRRAAAFAATDGGPR